MKLDPVLRLAAFATVLIGLGGCVPGALTQPPAGPVDVVVKVVATGGCKLNLPAAKNACRGVGDADGLACGRDGDTVRWIPNNTRTQLRSIEFAAGNNVVCDGGVVASGGDLVCKLNAQSGVSDQVGLAFKYEIAFASGRTECPPQDPYVIITRR